MMSKVKRVADGRSDASILFRSGRGMQETGPLQQQIGNGEPENEGARRAYHSGMVSSMLSLAKLLSCATWVVFISPSKPGPTSCAAFIPSCRV